MEMDEYEVRGAWCQMCGPSKTCCYTRCYLKDGVWERVEGCPQAANNGVAGGRSLCAKGNAAVRSLDSSQRLLYPMKRVGPKGPDAEFTRITWDEALDTISRVLLEQKKAYGPESFGILSPQAFPALSFIGRRFLNVHGSPNYCHSAICFMQRTASCHTVMGGPSLFGANSTAPARMDATELLVCWGVNPENAMVNHGIVRTRLENQRRGMKVIDIRPLCDPMAAKADIWLPVRPGTDLALALGILHVICGEDLYDQEFVSTWCYGFEELAAHVQQFTPEWAAERCGIPAEQIIQVARMIAAADPCGIVFGNGIGDQTRDGHWTICAVELIGAICGNPGKLGGGCDGPKRPLKPLIAYDPHPWTLPERLERTPQEIANDWPAGASRLVAPEFPQWYEQKGAGGVTSAYFKALMSILTEDPYPLRAVLAQSTNPLSATRQPELVAKALEKLEFFVVMDMFWNPSCNYADIVLPACSQYECSHLLGFKNTPRGTFLGISQKLAEAPGEALSDWGFYFKLAAACGYGDDFWGGDIEAYLAERLAPTGYSLEELRAMPDGLFVPRENTDACEGTASPACHNSRNTRLEGRFAILPHEKIQCVNEVVSGKPSVHDGIILPRLPEYRGPAEGLAETPEIARDYPLIFSDVHAHRLANHSYYNDIAVLRQFSPEPWVKMHPSTAAKYGIANGDWVRIESRHGWCVLQAQLTEGISPEVLMGRRGWNQGCPELGIPGYSVFNGGAEPNVLYPVGIEVEDDFHSSLGKTALVRITRSKEGPRV